MLIRWKGSTERWTQRSCFSQGALLLYEG